jgi:L-amino acid N-acyltransferase YncA
MQIRKALTEDLQQIADVAELFPAPGLPSYNREFFMDWWKPIFETNFNMSLVMLPAEKIEGIFLGVEMPDFATGSQVAAEMLWLTVGRARGHGMLLLDAFLAEARARKVRMVTLSCWANQYQETLVRCYRKKGFQMREISFLKMLEC